MSGGETGTRALIVGTAGHVDHGKTALVRALTGVDTDRWAEEKDRGLTIDLGFAPLELTPDLEVGIVDVPGHEDFVKNMLAGATGVDLLLLVVAADEGPMPQTREHLDIATLLGVRTGVVALNKVDRVGEEWLELARDTVREALRSTGVGDVERWPIVPASAHTGEGIDRLRRELAEGLSSIGERRVGRHFRLPVDRSFSLPGAGTVVTGTTWSGSVEAGEELRVLPGERRVRVRSIQVHGTERKAVGPGRRCGLALVGVDPDETPRGSVLVDDAPWRPASSLGARIRLLPHSPRSVEDGQRLRVFLGTREVMARARLLRETPLPPGNQDWARLELEDSLVARAGDRFVLRFYSPVTTIGGGRVVEPDAPPSWAARRESWRAVLGGPPPTAARAVVRLAGAGGLEPREVALRVPEEIESRRDSGDGPPPDVVEADGRWFPASVASDLEEELLDVLDAMHRKRPTAASVSLQALRAGVESDEVHPALVERALRRLQERGDVEISGGEARRPGHRPRLDSRERRARDTLVEQIRAAGKEPPTVGELQDTLGGDRELLHDLLDLLVSEGDLVEVSPDIYVAKEIEAAVRSGARELLRRCEGPVSAGDFREGLGQISRSYLIAYLEHLDRCGVTRRTPEGRVLADEA